MVKKCYYNNVLMNFEEKMKTRENKKMVKLYYFSKLALFGHILKKKNQHI